MYNKVLHEILTTRLWDFLPEALWRHRDAVFSNMQSRIPFAGEKSTLPYSYLTSMKSGFQDKIYVGNADHINWSESLDEEDRIINVIHIDGPITRGGGAFSYGSKEHRDIIMRAADMEQCIGHLFIIDTPGGCSFSKYDYKQAIDYARSKNQPIIALIDGLCCSAGYAVASQCDEIYFVHPADEVGCIGTMAAFYLQKNGDENAITHERYIELYAEGSPYKNKEMRDAADGDMGALQSDLQKSADDFKAMVRERRSSVTEEQLKGLTYKAGEVVGTLVDGQNDVKGCISRIMELSESDSNPDGLPDNIQGEFPDEKPEKDPVDPAEESEEKNDMMASAIENNNNQNFNKMKEYSKIQDVLGINDLQSNPKDNSLWLTEEYCDKLEARLQESEQKEDVLAAKMTEISNLNNMIKTLKNEHTDALERLKDEHSQVVEKLQAEHTGAIEALISDHKQTLDKQKDEYELMLTEANSKLEEKEKELGEAQEEIKKLNADIAELSSEPSNEPITQLEAPSDNNIGSGKAESINVCKSDMTPQERREALARREEDLRKRRNG